MFLYRENEINLLKEDFDKPNSTFSVIFGRRKVGKSSLINEYIKDKQALYLACFETMTSLLVEEFKKSIDIFFSVKNTVALSSLDDLFHYLSKNKIENKIVIVLEDIHNLLKIDKDFLINLNNYWNKYLKHMNIQLIITSSLLPNNFDKLQIVKKIDNNIRLHSLSFNTIKKLLPKLSKDDAMYVYAAFGTNPKYLSLYNENKDFILNIKDNYLTYDSFLYNEGMNIIKKDLGDAVTYSSILYSISMGNNKIGDIAKFLNLKSSYLTRYMQKLVDLMIINKITPINEVPGKSKFGRYEIEDNFLKFWFCYVYPNANYINSNNFYPVLKHIRLDFSKRLVTSAYKKHVLEVLENDVERFFNYIPKKIGSWWNNKDFEIDFVGYDSKTITFIDCKWRKNNSIKSEYDLLEKKAKYFDTQLEKKYIIFTKKPQTSK
jgi:AAA+ ATPase superfamily predicted ATPase